MSVLRQEAKVYGVALICMAAFALANSPLRETRSVRDMLGETAFRDVLVYQASVTDREMTLRGQFTKWRCDRQTLIAQTLHNGVWRYAGFRSTEGPEVPLSRLGEGVPSAFGDWVITAYFPLPERARIATRHICPHEGAENAKRQDNEVLNVRWQNQKEVTE